MSQITWKNIAAPDFKSAMWGMDKAGEKLSGALDPLEKIITDRQAIDQQNYETGVDNTTMGIQANLEKINSLGEFNQMQDSGQFDVGRLQEQFGTGGADWDAVKTGVKERQGTLQEQAFRAALPDATSVADKSMSLTDGLTALRENLTIAGMRPDVIQAKEAKFLASNEGRKAQYADTRKKNTENILQQFGTPTTNKEIQAFQDQADKLNIPYDRDYFRDTLERELKGYKSDVGFDQQRELFNQAKADRQKRERQEQEFASTVKQIGVAAQNQDIGQALQIVNGAKDLTGGQMGQLIQTIGPMMKTYGMTTATQDADIQAATTKATSQLEAQEAWYQQRGKDLNKRVADATGITPEFLEFVKDTHRAGKVPGDTIAEAMPHKWLHISALFAKQGGDAKDKFNEQVRNVMKVTKNEPEAIALVYIAAKEVADGKLPIKEFDDAIAHRIGMYKNAAGVISDRNLFQERSDHELRSMKSALQDWATGIPKGVVEGNTAGKPYQVPEFSLPTKNTLYDKYQTKKLQDSVRAVFGPLQSSHQTSTELTDGGTTLKDVGTKTKISEADLDTRQMQQKMLEALGNTDALDSLKSPEEREAGRQLVQKWRQQVIDQEKTLQQKEKVALQKLWNSVKDSAVVKRFNEKGY